jgi:hypothetical protein
LTYTKIIWHMDSIFTAVLYKSLRAKVEEALVHLYAEQALSLSH